MYKPAVAVLGTTCLLMGLFLKYTLASNIQLKKEFKALKDDVEEIKKQIGPKHGENTSRLSQPLPVRSVNGGNPESAGVSDEGGRSQPVSEVSA